MKFPLLLLMISATQLLSGEVSFNRDIRPILSNKCYACHGFDQSHRESDLRLDKAESAQEVLSAGKPNESELLRRITSDVADEVMPPLDSHKQRLTEDQVSLIRRWIAEGAKYENHWAFVAPTRPKVDWSEVDSSAVNLSVSRFATAALEASGKANATVFSAVDSIDYFVAKQLQERDLQFAKPATPTKWLRRMTLDLIGLPPTLAELDAFEEAAKKNGQAAYVDAVERVLKSPHFGERLALEWLDVARYADTHGFQEDAYRMNWPWRDWVVRAFNDNMPYDQFTIEQLAGDLLENPTQDQMIATAFNRNHMINGEGGAIREENLAKTGFDRVETTSTTWLGLTVGCCQCHDHKFDPLKQTDYYSLFAFFNQVDEKASNFKQFKLKAAGQKYEKKYMADKPFIALATPEQERELADLNAKVKSAEARMEEARPEFQDHFVNWIKEIRASPELAVERIDNLYIRRNVNTFPLEDPNNGDARALTKYFLQHDERWSDLVAEIDEAKKAEDALQAKVPLVMVMRDDMPRQTFVLERGNYETPGQQVEAGVPEFLPSLSLEADNTATAKADRLTLARWLVSDEHPLTSRVTVNRYWQLIFGRGLVATPDDFGLQGALPTHPELLDWLAVEFRESGWNVKRLLKAMVLSRTYRQSAEVDADVIQRDPDNIWLTRGPRLRLDSRLIRDQALAISGLLVSELGGPPVFPYHPIGIWEEMSLNKNHYEQDSGDKLYRRSLYTIWRRVVSPANFFDVASRQSCYVRTQRTSTPLHALTLLNDTTYIEAARVWAARVSDLPDDETRLQRMFFAATARHAEQLEIDSMLATLAKARQHFESMPEEAAKFIAMGESGNQTKIKPAEQAAWTSVCLMLLNLDETLAK